MTKDMKNEYLIIAVPSAEISDVVLFESDSEVERAKISYSQLVSALGSVAEFDDAVSNGSILVYDAPDYRISEWHRNDAI